MELILKAKFLLRLEKSMVLIEIIIKVMKIKQKEIYMKVNMSMECEKVMEEKYIHVETIMKDN